MKIRQSNIELLRIIAMLQVLLIHANFGSLGSPTALEMCCNTVDSLFRIVFQTISVCFVDVFILISGWFGIRLSWNGLWKFIFQWLFFTIGLYITSLLLFNDWISIERIKNCFSNWFVLSYLLLYIISPVLNHFTEHASKNEFKIVLFLFFLYQTVLGWMFTGLLSFIDDGYSPISFCGLYLLARYCRLYTPTFISGSAKRDLKYIFLLIVFNVFIFSLPLILFGSIGGGKFLSYISPTTIVMALFVLIFFSKLTITNKAVNWLAASCFAVFLIHTEPHVMPYYKELFISFHQIELTDIPILNVFVFWCITLFTVLMIFVISVLLDQIRIIAWNLINKCHIIGENI